MSRNLEPGEYLKENGIWYARPITKEDINMTANLGAHDITEHDDGTITVSPSILITRHDNKRWHGYLRNGKWERLNDSNV